MRIIRVRHNGRVFYASLGEDHMLTCLQRNLGYAEPLPMSEVSLMPLVAPSKISCVGLNFRDHAAEIDMPLSAEPSFFLKPPSSLLGNGQTILLPRNVGRIDYEAELAVIIGQHCRHVSPEQAAGYVFGYTCANDVTARDLQQGERMFGRCKGYDTFCPLGPWIETGMPPEDSAVRAVVNGEVRQQGILRDMIANPLELISYLSGIMSLTPGDVILTGTPKGVGPIAPGDTVQIEVENVGVLFNSVDREDESDFTDGDAPVYRLQ